MKQIGKAIFNWGANKNPINGQADYCFKQFSQEIKWMIKQF